MFKRKLFIIILGLFAMRANATGFVHYSVGEGLPFVQVSGIAQASSGELWLGGYAGLAAYDGVDFKHFELRERLPHSNITALKMVDDELYAGTTKGVFVFKNNEFHTASAFSNAREEVISIEKVHDKMIAVYADKVVDISNLNSEITLLDFEHRIFCSTVHDNRLFVGTAKGLFEVTNGAARRIEGSENYKVISLTGGSGLFVGTNRGLFTMNDMGAIEKSDISNKIIGRGVYEILMFDSNTTFIATEFGLNRCKNGDCEYLSIDKTERSGEINTLFKDREGNLWVGTNFGLYKFTTNAFTNYNKNEGLPDAFIYGIDSGPSGLWVATGKGGIAKYANNTFTRYGKRHGMLGGVYRDVLCVGDSVIAACNKGISVRTANGIENITFSGDSRISGVNTVFQNNDGDIVLCTKSGAGILKGRKYNPIFYEEDLDFETWAGVQDENGNYWFATYEGGLWFVENGEARRIDNELSINGKQYLALAADYESNIWIGTFNGVYVYSLHKDSVIKIDERAGLNSGLIYSFLLDTDSNMWVGTNQGINRIRLPQFFTKQYMNILTFGKKEGFSGVECNVNGAHMSGKDLWFGTVDGLMRFEPGKYTTNNVPPVINIRSTKLFYSDTLFPEGVELAHNENHITFNFLGVSLSNPSQVKYSFMLEGFDQNWSPPDYLSPATYSSLPPGNYTFKVKSANSRGVWNEEPVEFSFKIKKHFSQTAWFRSVAGGGFLTGAALLYIFQIRRYRVKRELERKLDTLKLKSLRSQMNPHFIFNSMNSIQYFINRNEKLEANRYLSKFASLMRKMLNNSREEMVVLAEDIKALKLYLELEKMRFEDKFEYEIQYDETIADEILIPPMIVQPFVENAIIHGFSKIDYPGMLKINFKVEDNKFVCIVDDNGRGVNRSKSTTSKTLHNSASTSITTERIETLTKLYNRKGTLEIKDKSNLGNGHKGTIVEISFPVTYI